MYNPFAEKKQLTPDAMLSRFRDLRLHRAFVLLGSVRAPEKKGWRFVVHKLLEMFGHLWKYRAIFRSFTIVLCPV